MVIVKAGLILSRDVSAKRAATVAPTRTGLAECGSLSRVSQTLHGAGPSAALIHASTIPSLFRLLMDRRNRNT
jgi:hypothetical protein